MSSYSTPEGRGWTKLIWICIVTFAPVVLRAIPSYGWVQITSPTNDSTESGTITVQANVKSDYWAQLRVDGKAVASTGVANGTVTLTWNTTSIADGAHWVKVLGYQKSATSPDSSEQIAVSVLNTLSADQLRRFGTLPASAPLPSGYWCSQVVKSEPENVPNNQTPNNTVPTSAQLATYANGSYNADPWNGTWAFARVDGQYTGTTDMINRWAACKWGVDEDVVRAQLNNEHWSWDQTTSHGDMRTSTSLCENNNIDLWNYMCTNCCYQSWSNFQTKVFNDWMTWPMMYTTTAFSVDYRFADNRACMNGDYAGYFSTKPAYNGHTYAGDIATGNLSTILWGCIGFHFSGNWYDGDSTSGAIWYDSYIQKDYINKPWKKRWPFVNWPD